VLAVAALVYVLALADVLLFWNFARTGGTLDLQDERLSALRQVTEPAVGLLAYGPCIDPTLLKVVSTKSVASFHPGISWPERKDEIDHIKQLWKQGLYDPVALRASGVTHLVTDSGCATTWDVAGTSGALRISSEGYTTAASTGTMTLWSLR
jgi:hypothetical protein